MLPSILYLIPGFLVVGTSGYVISKSPFIALPLSFQHALPFCAHDCLALELSAQFSTSTCLGSTAAHCLCHQRAGAGAAIGSAAQSCLQSSCSSSTTRFFLDRVRHLCHNTTSTPAASHTEYQVGHETILTTKLKSHHIVIAREAAPTATASSASHSQLSPVIISCVVIAAVAIFITTILVIGTCILRNHRRRKLMKDQTSMSGRFGHARRLTNLSASEKTASTTCDFPRSSQKTLVELPTPTTYPKPSRWEPAIPDSRGIGVAMTIVDDNIVSPVSAFGVYAQEKPLPPPPPAHSRPGSTATIFEEDKAVFEDTTDWAPAGAQDHPVHPAATVLPAPIFTSSDAASNRTPTKPTEQTMDLPLFVTGSAETFYRDSGALQLHTGITHTPDSRRDSAGTEFEDDDDDMEVPSPHEAAITQTQSNALNIMRLDATTKRPALSKISIPKPFPGQTVRTRKQASPEQADTHLRTTPQIVLTSPDPAQQSVLLSAELHSGRSFATTDYLPEYYTRTPQTVVTMPDTSPSAHSSGAETSPTSARRRRSPTTTSPYPLIRAKTAPAGSTITSPVELEAPEPKSAQTHSFPTPSSYYPDSPLSTLDYPPIPKLPGTSISPHKQPRPPHQPTTTPPRIRGKTAPFPLHPINQPSTTTTTTTTTATTPPRTSPSSPSKDRAITITPPRKSPTHRSRPETPRLRTATPSQTLEPIDERVAQRPPPPPFILPGTSTDAIHAHAHVQRHTATNRIERWLRDDVPTPRLNGERVVVPMAMPVPMVAGVGVASLPEEEDAVAWPLRMYDGPALGGRGKGSLGPGYGGVDDGGGDDGYGGSGSGSGYIRMPSRGPGEVNMI